MKKEQSLAGFIRERLASIEQRLSVGIRQEVILAELIAAGYETSLSNFRNELWRARKKREKHLAKTASTAAPTLPSSAGKAVPAQREPEPARPAADTKVSETDHVPGLTNKTSAEKKASQYLKSTSLADFNVDELVNNQRSKK